MDGPSRTLAWQGGEKATRVGFPLGDNDNDDIIYDALTRGDSRNALTLGRVILFLDNIVIVEAVVESTARNTTADNSTIVNIVLLSMLHRNHQR